MGPQDLPTHLRPVIANADKLIRDGARVFFKFTCGKCGVRQTFPDPDAFYVEGVCEECAHVTNLLEPAANVNYAVVFSPDEKGRQFLKELKKLP